VREARRRKGEEETGRRGDDRAKFNLFHFFPVSSAQTRVGFVFLKLNPTCNTISKIILISKTNIPERKSL